MTLIKCTYRYRYCTQMKGGEYNQSSYSRFLFLPVLYCNGSILICRYICTFFLRVTHLHRKADKWYRIWSCEQTFRAGHLMLLATGVRSGQWYQLPRGREEAVNRSGRFRCASHRDTSRREPATATETTLTMGSAASSARSA